MVGYRAYDRRGASVLGGCLDFAREVNVLEQRDKRGAGCVPKGWGMIKTLFTAKQQ